MTVSRKSALDDLIKLNRSVSAVTSDLKIYPWDSTDHLVTLTNVHIVNILSRFMDNEISASTVEEWANAIEGRDDIDYSSSEAIILAIHELANPLLTQPITKQSVQNLISRLIA